MATPDKPVASVLAAMAIGVLSLGPFAVALDLWIHFLPDRPVFQYMRSVSPVIQGGWIALGPIGVLATVLLLRRPPVGALLTAVFVAAYVPFARLLWGHFSWGCWLAVAAAGLAILGAIRWARSNNSFKPKPLRGSP
jgi:hypothetical protein